MKKKERFLKTERKVLKQHIPCPCGKSSDAYTIYVDGGHCYSCGKNFKNEMEMLETAEETPITLQRVPYRGHTLEALEKYQALCEVSTETGDIVGALYQYPSGAEKRRDIKNKRFTWKNYKGPGLFGKDRFPAGSARAITITEGEEDTYSAYAMLGHKYPVVSVQSSSQAAKDCAADKEYLDTFEKIYLDFDNDEPGRRAVLAVSAMFPFDKVYVVKKDLYKDANEYEVNNAHQAYRNAWYSSKRHNPENIVSSWGDVGKILAHPKKKAICDFPFKGLQEATFGIRTGETYLFKALEGIGKTEVLGAIEYHVVKNTDFPIGVIHLEEDLQRTTMRFIGYEVEQPVHLEGFTDYGVEEMLEIYKRVTKEDNRVNYFQQGKNDADVEAFLNAIRFLVVSAGCKIVFFDHISRVATTFSLDTTGLDNFATALSSLAMELDFALIMVSHVNDDGLTRGSRNISKEAWTVINLSRDKLSPDPNVRNTLNFTVEKNRHASITGPAGFAVFDSSTFKLEEPRTFLLPQAAG